MNNMVDVTYHNIELLRRAVKVGLNNFLDESRQLYKYRSETTLTLSEDFEINPLLLTSINIPSKRGIRRRSFASALVDFLFAYEGYERPTREIDTVTPTGIVEVMGYKIGHGTSSLSKFADALKLPKHESLIILAKAVDTGGWISNAPCQYLTSEYIRQFPRDYEEGLTDITDQRYELCRSLVQKCIVFNRRVEQIGLDFIARLVEDPTFDADSHLSPEELRVYGLVLADSNEFRVILSEQRRRYYPERNGSYRKGELEELRELNRRMPIKYLQKESDLIGGGLTIVENIIEDLTKGYQLGSVL
jgi:hypothetical protein